MRDDVEEAVQQVHQLLEVQSKVILGIKDFSRVPQKTFFNWQIFWTTHAK